MVITGSMIQQPKKLVACFGTLKKGFYNHEMLGNAKFMGSVDVKGVMYLHGTYPRLYHAIKDDPHFGFDKERHHTAEIYYVEYPLYEDILYMERGAGYVEETIDTGDGKASIFFNPHEVFSPDYDKWIESYTQSLFDNK
jgi:gamma-glutamylcyclotransferase (GGCT)/AIG2-like uncharacterized protein YtfP